MKNMRLSEKINITSFKRLAALLLVLVMLVGMIGCKKDPNKDTNSSNSSNQSQSDNANSSDAPSDNTSSDGTSTDGTSSDTFTDSNIDNNYGYGDTTSDTSSDKSESSSNTSTGTASVNPLKGNITVEYEYEAGTSRTDAEEIEHSIDPAGYNKGYVGYREADRIKRRDEILNTPNTLDLYDVKGTVYYVSTKGSDANDGLSPKTPIQTLFAVDALVLKPGDAVLFERGSLWRLTENLACKSGVIYGSYGEGRKPMIFGSPKNFAQEIWKPANKKNVWKMTYIYAYPGGMFFNEGKEIGYLKLGLRDLNKNTDFYLDTETSTLYLYCDKGNPSNVWKSIEVSQTFTCVKFGNGNDGTVFDNFTIRYCGTHSISAGYANRNMTVTNCEIGYNGGAWTGGEPGTNRYGNSVESWCGGYGFTVNNCWIYQNFDTAASPQGNDSKKSGDYANISVSNNLFEYNNADLEFWDGPGESGMAYFINTVCDNNIHRFTALGWGTRTDDGGVRGIDGLIFGGMSLGQLKSFSFSNNIIDCPGTHMYKFGIVSYDEYKKFKRVGNVFYLRQSLRWTTALTSRAMVWTDKDTQITENWSASTEAETIKAFKEFEPNATVYWYKN
ncbi:MAG: hypothetical protein IJD71_00060 [Clostridia bacterium]|nr:hypothetical protein [Clostridia bacterium]